MQTSNHIHQVANHAQHAQTLLKLKDEPHVTHAITGDHWMSYMTPITDTEHCICVVDTRYQFAE